MLLPTPGSPASRIAAPGTRPPPSTRSSSGTPLLRNDAESTETWAIGTAALVTGPASDRLARVVAASATEPQAWHSPHLPTHFAEAPAALGAQVGRAGGLRHASHARRRRRHRPATRRTPLRVWRSAAASRTVSSRLDRSRGRTHGVERATVALGADPGRRGRARGGVAADRLERRQQPRAPATRHPGPRAGRDLRAGLLAQPGRSQPAHPVQPPDRAEVQPRPGGHGERRHGPLRAHPGRDLR